MTRYVDCLVAEQIMGLIRCQNPWHLEGIPCHAQPDSPGSGGETPAYSSDLATAWLVVEKIRNTGEAPEQTYWVFTDYSEIGWRAEVLQVLTENDAPHHVAAGIGETLPLAICRAALAAVDAGSWTWGGKR